LTIAITGLGRLRREVSPANPFFGTDRAAGKRDAAALVAGARVADAVSGSVRRVADAPDALIATERWGENGAPVELAGGPAPSQVAAAAPEPILLSRTVAPSAPTRVASAAPERAMALTPLSVPLSRLSWAPVTKSRAAPEPEPRISLTISDQAVVPTGAGLEIGSNSFSEPVVAMRPPSSPLDLKHLALQVTSNERVRGKGRWFLFAAGSGQAFGLNLLRDPVRGWKPAGWSVERLAEFGKAQLGIGWRKGSRQIALSAARREISAYGISREDTVLGVTFTVSGRKPDKTRFEQRLPQAR